MHKRKAVENKASATKTGMFLWKRFLIKTLQDLKHWTIFTLITQYSSWHKKVSLVCLFLHPSKFTGKPHLSFPINIFYCTYVNTCIPFRYTFCKVVGKVLIFLIRQDDIWYYFNKIIAVVKRKKICHCLLIKYPSYEKLPKFYELWLNY